MNRPTNEQIQKEIEALKEIKPKVRRLSLFGDNHHAAIDAQIAVLEDGLDEDVIYDEFGGVDNVRSAALDALSWLSGEWDVDDYESSGPAESWQELVV